MKKRTRYLGMVLSLLFLLCGMAVPVQAVEIVDSGSLGENITWTVYSDGLLDVVGSGAMDVENPYPTEGLHEYRELITKLQIQEGITTIGFGSFYDLNITSVVIPESVEEIMDESFSRTDLTSINIPAKVSDIDSGAFEGCDMREFTCAEDNQYYCAVDGVLFNKDKTQLINYPAASLRETYTIPSSVTEIRSMAFYNAINLTDMQIPDTVTKIGYAALCGCTGLTYLNFHENLILGSESIEGCDYLLSVNVPAANTVIPHGCFLGCDNLYRVSIPATVTEISAYAFYNCPSLQEVYFGGTQEQWEAIEVEANNWGLGGATVFYNSTMPDTPVPVEEPTTQPPVTQPEEQEEDNNDKPSFIERIKEFFQRIMDFFRNLFN